MVPNPKLHCLLLEHRISIAWLIKHWFSFHNQFIRHHEYQCAIQHSIKHHSHKYYDSWIVSFFSFFYLFDAISCVRPISNLFYFQYLSSLLATVRIYIRLMRPPIRHFNKSSDSASSTVLCVLHFDILKRLSLFFSLQFLFFLPEDLILLFISCADWTIYILQEFAKSMAKYSCDLSSRLRFDSAIWIERMKHMAHGCR